MLEAANHASRLNKCMRPPERLHKKRRTRRTDSRPERKEKNCDHPSFYLSVSLAPSSLEGVTPSRKLAKNQTESPRRKRERRRCRFRSTRDPTNLQFNVGIGTVERIRRRSGESRRRGDEQRARPTVCTGSASKWLESFVTVSPWRVASHAHGSL